MHYFTVHGERDLEKKDESDVEVVDDQSVAPLYTSSINTYRKDLSTIEDLSLFLQSKRHATEANEVIGFKAKLQALIVNNSVTQDKQLY